MFLRWVRVPVVPPMSDYEQLPMLGALLLITFPLWFPIWAIWFVFDKFVSKKEETQKVIVEKQIPAPLKSGPNLFRSISEKNKFYNDQIDHG